MKHVIIFFAIFFASLVGMPAVAQKNGRPPQQKVEMRAAHLVAILGLSDSNSSRFINLYTQYTQEMRAARVKYAKIKPNKAKDQKPAPLTDEQVKKNIENSFALSQTILDIRKKYYVEFLKVITPRQLERLYELEKKDGEHLREMAQKRKRKK